MPSGADLEYARLLAASGLGPDGLDGARLQQIEDEKYHVQADADGNVLGRASEKLKATYARQLNQPGTPSRNPRPTVMHRHTAIATEVVTATINTVYDIDATNLVASFIVPPSGMVDVTLQASYRNVTTGLLDWWLRDSGGNAMKDPSGDFCSARVGPNNATTTPNPARVTMRVAKDSAGNNLTPGSRITLRWGHSASTDNGYTAYGGPYAPARMEIVPVSHRLTERRFTQTIANTGYSPLWLTQDRTLLLGINNSSGRLAWSTDDGSTWTTRTTADGMSMVAIRDLDNGELAVFCGQGDNGQVWTSTGWATDKQTATFAKRLDFTGSPPSATYGAHPAPWGVDAFGEIVLAAEYGPKTGTADMARYVYLSEDSGITWRTIFDLAQKRPNGGSADAHLHGVCYDPWWDAIWVINGDNSQRGHWVSFDRGNTWTEFLRGTSLQFTTVAPMRDCILLVSDIAADGVYRIPRVSKTRLLVELAHSVAGAGINIVGMGWYQNRMLPDAPMLLAANAAGNGTDPGRAFATYDGYDFVEFFTDTINYADLGARMFVGPTTANKFHGFVIRGGTVADWQHATVSLT